VEPSRRLGSVRNAVLTIAMLLTACDATSGMAASGRSSATPSPSSSSSPNARVTTPTTRDCTVSWVDHFTTLSELVAKADVIVRAVAVAQDTAQLTPGFGAQSTRDARRTTFRVVETLKGTVSGSIRVLEDVCMNLDVRSDEEWLLFGYRWDSTGHGPAEGGEHFMTRGGPQGQFRFGADRVIGPFFVFAGLVHSYEGATIDEVLADVRAAVR
jgi:hypothetical protein